MNNNHNMNDATCGDEKVQAAFSLNKFFFFIFMYEDNLLRIISRLYSFT